ncbi:hypothetical protein [Pantoea dispersa]|uniref:hypothetical protein n=1 Tax=Pantoea dispersa TaxID=59814 RepID=UPI000FDAA973|nr:hypothetical protein [Pantoea dispersa]RVU76604.1 hypothetical protein EKH82_11885 [Pantoea dispersa]
MLTKNFRLNALANSYAAALYEHIKLKNGGDYFMTTVNGGPLKVEIVGGPTGVRQLIDAYFLEALKESYQGWEAVAMVLLDKCLLNGKSITSNGISLWESMVSDMGSTVGGNWNA